MEALNHLVDSSLVIEKLRVTSEIRLSHLKRNHVQDPDTEELHKRTLELEQWVNERVAVLIREHPAYPWFSKVKGIGKENIAKVIGGVRVKPEQGYRKLINGAGEEEFVLVDLPYADTISGLWKFAGMDVQEGKAPKRSEGAKLTYNSQLRSMCWRLGNSLLRARGKFYEYYVTQKERYQQRYLNAGMQIVPVTKLPARIDPKTKKKIRYEPEGIIAEGHVHNQALRKTIKLFLACLWLEWRKGEGMPVTKPYVIDQLRHNSYITPEDMTDR